MKRFLFVVAAVVALTLVLSACGEETKDNTGGGGTNQTTGQTNAGGQNNTATGGVNSGKDLSDDNNDGKIDRNGDDGKTSDDNILDDAGDMIDDAANGVGDAAKDVVDGAEDVVDNATGSTNRSVNNNN